VGTMRATLVSTGAAMVHPHGRGDNARKRPRRARAVGSPPRAWGQSPARGIFLVLARFTPTGVGTMVLCAWQRVWFTVHPHGRGDNGLNDAYLYKQSGSPPRAWGQ